MSYDLIILISYILTYSFMLITIAFAVYITLKKLIAFYFQKKEEYRSKEPFR